MIDKLISNLKQSLPESLRKNMGMKNNNSDNEEYSEEESESNHNVSDSKNEDQSKNRKSMLIKVVVVIGLGYLAIDHFFLSENLQNETANIQLKPKKHKVKPIPPKNNTADQKSPDNKTEIKIEEKAIMPNSGPKETKSDVNIENKTALIEPPIENVNITDKKIEEIIATKKEEAPEKIVENIAVPKASVESTSKTGEVKNNEQVDQNLDSLIDSIDAKEKTPSETATKKEIKLEDKIVADDVYVAPPGYDLLGRGLVYNCKEKHWACVDKLSYVNCNKNMKWNKTHVKPAECAVVNVYNSKSDCSVVQKYNVSISKETVFCQ